MNLDLDTIMPAGAEMAIADAETNEPDYLVSEIMERANDRVGDGTNWAPLRRGSRLPGSGCLAPNQHRPGLPVGKPAQTGTLTGP